MLTLANTAGCYSTWDIQPKSLHALDGFRVGSYTPSLQATNGEVIEFDESTSLQFKGNTFPVSDEIRFLSVDVEEEMLIGTMRGKGGRVQIDLSQLRGVRAQKPAPGKTAGMVLGIVAGSGLFLFGLAVLFQSPGGGRPLHVAGRDFPVRADVLLNPRACRPLRDNTIDEATERRILAHWANEASAESASIPAFIALARDLRRVGAPTGLVAQALRAAREEAIHTELCRSLANAHSPMELHVETPATPVPMDLDRQTLLRRLALEAFWDGCLAEGVAASVAQRSVHRTKDATTRNALCVIARDERHHAELSRQILDYCLLEGGLSIRDALVAIMEEKRCEEARIDRFDAEDDAYDEDSARGFGLAGHDVWQAARAEVWEQCMATMSQLC